MLPRILKSVIGGAVTVTQTVTVTMKPTEIGCCISHRNK